MVKNIPGRKTDVADCQWTCPSGRRVQQLHSYGLLRASFIPDDNTRKIRSYVRLRRTNIRLGADNIQRAQKSLTS